MTHVHHALDYIELPAPDLSATTGFYASAFGWRFNDYGGMYAGIRSADGEGEVGGLNPEAGPGPVGVLALLYSDDLEASVAAVEAAGGTITQPPYAFPGGHRFHFTDVAGNELGVWTEATT